MNVRLSALFVAVLLAAPAMSQTPGGDKEKSDDKKVDDKKVLKPRGKFTIGKETTVVEGPLSEDGYIDYVAALNERLSRDITPATNANVLLWKAMGPRPEGSRMPDDFFKWLGIERLPDKGDYFVSYVAFLKERKKIDPDKDADVYEVPGRAAIHPWTAKEQPDLAAWLKANEKPLNLVVLASRRPHYFNPLVPGRSVKGSSPLIGALLPGVQKCRDFATALAARAMLRTAEGDIDGAWSDLVACHRLGRLSTRGGTLIENLVGIAIDSVAGRADLSFVERARPSSTRLASCLKDLQALPPHQPISESIDLGERFMLLDIFTHIDRGGVTFFRGMVGAMNGQSGESFPGSDKIVNLFLQGGDWDPALRHANGWYDRLVAVMRLKNRAVREKHLRNLELELKSRKANLLQRENVAALVFGGSEGRGKVFSDLMTSVMTPAFIKVLDTCDRTTQNEANLKLAFALARYERDHGRYPDKLDALAPKYLAEVPGDLFSGKALVYRPMPKGYLLYSVGVNGQDEGGRGHDDAPGEDGVRGDDLVIRMPVPPPMRQKD